MRIFAKVLPRVLKKKYEENMLYARIKDTEKTIGFLIFNGLIFSLVVGVILFQFISILLTVLFTIVFFLFIEIFFYYSLVLKADAISKKMEEVLPDALQLMASNLRAGMTTERALLLSSRDEFGELKYEIDRVGREIATGKGVIESLKAMAKRFRSEKLKKSIQLISSGLSAGGELAPLLEQISSNLRESEFVDKKIRTNILMYVIFIFVSVGVGAPALFGLSSFLIEVLTQQLSGINVPETASSTIPFGLSTVNVSPETILIYLLILLATTSILGSLILGLISSGEEKAGIKYIPFLLALSISLFFLIRVIVKNTLSGLLGFG